MATSTRGLAFVLTIGIFVVSPASVPPGSASSGWWGSQEALKLRQAARASTAKGAFSDTERIYREGAELAASHHDRGARAWFLSGVGDARFASYNYRGALDAYLQAREFAEKARDPLCLGSIDFNLSSLYMETGDPASALRSADQARTITQRLANVYYRPHLLLLLGELRADVGSIPLYRESIKAAAQAARPPVEANGWQLLGEALIRSGDLGGAEDAEQKALALRQRSVPRDLGFSYWVLSALRLKQAERVSKREKLLKDAEDFNRRARLEDTRKPAYLLQYQRGAILLAQHRDRDALGALEQAIDQSQRWRLGIAPTISSIDGTATELQARIFDGFVHAAAEFGIRTGDPRWIEESFQATELNRAINLRDSAQSSWRRTLPLEYWEVLGQLQAQESGPAATQSSASGASDRLRLRLTELEARAGLGLLPNIAENFPSHTLLSLFRQSLKDSQILLSFALGDRESFLWAATGDTLHVYRLPPEDRIVGTVRAFRQAIEAEGTGFEDLGERLYTMLFGQLTSQERSKTAWFLSAEDALLELPFAALVVEHDRRSGHVVFLVERHSVQLTAGALLPGRGAPQSSGGFVSVGDPIYNTADPRWISSGWAGSSPLGSGRAGSSPLGSGWLDSGWLGSGWSRLFAAERANQLNRLPGSHREVELSAAAWGGSSTTRTVVLEGASASRTRFLQSLSPVPQAIHLATHALTSAGGDEAYLAFGIGPDRQADLLSTSEIRTLNVPGSVVVMTGCATAPNDVKAGVGLAGLVRAWTIAGASAVVATEWPVQDSSGASLLASFYRHLARDPPGAAAEALRMAQIETIRGRATAAEWAAYQVFGGKPGSYLTHREVGEGSERR